VLTPPSSFNSIFPDPGAVQVFNVAAGQAIVLPFHVAPGASFINANIQLASDSRSTPSGQSETVAMELWGCVNGAVSMLRSVSNGSAFKTIYITTGTATLPYVQLMPGLYWIVLRSIGGQPGGGIVTSTGVTLTDGNKNLFPC
jgi:hypothetical protein